LGGLILSDLIGKIKNILITLNQEFLKRTILRVGYLKLGVEAAILG